MHQFIYLFIFFMKSACLLCFGVIKLIKMTHISSVLKETSLGLY